MLRAVLIASTGLAFESCTHAVQPAAAPPSAEVLPDTPAARALAGWLGAYNTGNADSMRAFAVHGFTASALAARSATARAEGDQWMHLNLGPMRVVRLEQSTDTSITAVVWQQLIEGWGRVTVRIASDSLPHVVSRSISFFDPQPVAASSGLVPRHRPDVNFARELHQCAAAHRGRCLFRCRSSGLR